MHTLTSTLSRSRSVSDCNINIHVYFQAKAETPRWSLHCEMAKKRFAPTSATFFADSMSLTKINSWRAWVWSQRGYIPPTPCCGRIRLVASLSLCSMDLTNEEQKKTFMVRIATELTDFSMSHLTNVSRCWKVIGLNPILHPWHVQTIRSMCQQK